MFVGAVPSSFAFALLLACACDSTAVRRVGGSCGDAGAAVAGATTSAAANSGSSGDCPTSVVSDSNASAAAPESAVEPEPNEADQGSGANSSPPKSCALHSANLISNAHFETRGELLWEVNQGEFVRRELDERSAVADGSGSLSIRLRSSSEDSGRMVSGVVRCVQVDGDSPVLVTADYLIDAAAPGSTEAGFTVVLHETRDCSDVAAGVWNSLVGRQAGRWSTMFGVLRPHADVRSLAVRLNVSKRYRDAGTTVLYDDVAVLPLADSVTCSGFTFSPDGSESQGGSGAGSQGGGNTDAGKPSPGAGDDSSQADDDSSHTPRDDDSDDAAGDDGADEGVSNDDDDSNDPDGDDSGANSGSDDSSPADDADDDGSDDDSNVDDSASADDDATPAPSYADSLESLFASRCVELCHTPGGLGGSNGLYPGISLDLTADSAYAQLTSGTTSNQAAGMLLVGADVDSSYLWAKLVGSFSDVGGAGERMPSGGADALSDAELELVRAWIEGGAAP